jgi:predicted permease
VGLFEDSSSNGDITAEGYRAGPDEDVHVMRNSIAPGHFATLGIPLLAGREFEESDRAGGPKVVIINEKLAKKFFAGRNPLGLHIASGSGDVHPDMEIVGVVQNSKHIDARDEIRPTLYSPYMQDTDLSSATFYVRTALEPPAMIGTLRKAVLGFDSNLPAYNAQALADQVNQSVFADQMLTACSFALGLLAALLAAVGLYGVMAYVVTRRTREIGIRMALGASRGHAAALILREVAQMAAIGLAIGLPAAFGLGRAIESQLYGVRAFDPLVLAIAAALLAVVACLAGWLPARRAAGVDPMVALRYE